MPSIFYHKSLVQSHNTVMANINNITQFRFNYSYCIKDKNVEVLDSLTA